MCGRTPDETADIMMQHGKGLSRETVRAIVGYLDADVRVSKATVQATQQGYDFAVKIGALKQAPTFEEVFDLKILRQVEKEHPELDGLRRRFAGPRDAEVTLDGYQKQPDVWDKPLRHLLMETGAYQIIALRTSPM